MRCAKVQKMDSTGSSRGAPPPAVDEEGRGEGPAGKAGIFGPESILGAEVLRDLQRTHVSFDWPAIAQHMRTHVQFHISCGLSLFAYLDFCELQMDAFGEHLLRLGSDVVRGERLRCGRLGPSPAT